jgi:hypothetical protein
VEGANACKVGSQVGIFPDLARHGFDRRDRMDQKRVVLLTNITSVLELVAATNLVRHCNDMKSSNDLGLDCE